jgi:hypothetical protein
MHMHTSHLKGRFVVPTMNTNAIVYSSVHITLSTAFTEHIVVVGAVVIVVVAPLAAVII